MNKNKIYRSHQNMPNGVRGRVEVLINGSYDAESYNVVGNSGHGMASVTRADLLAEAARAAEAVDVDEPIEEGERVTLVTIEEATERLAAPLGAEGLQVSQSIVRRALSRAGEEDRTDDSQSDKRHRCTNPRCSKYNEDDLVGGGLYSPTSHLRCRQCGHPAELVTVRKRQASRTSVDD